MKAKLCSKRKYDKLILQLENRTFTPIAFSTNVGMGKEVNKCYSQIANKLSENWDVPYSVMMYWIWRKIHFSMMKSIIMCIRGSWSSKHEREKHKIEELASYSEARCHIMWLIKEKLWPINMLNMLNTTKHNQC